VEAFSPTFIPKLLLPINFRPLSFIPLIFSSLSLKTMHLKSLSGFLLWFHTRGIDMDPTQLI
jgi:hypothetical protein